MHAHPMPRRGRPLANLLLTLLGLALVLTLWGGPAAAQSPTFLQFESGPVRPMAMSPDIVATSASPAT